MKRLGTVNRVGFWGRYKELAGVVGISAWIGVPFVILGGILSNNATVHLFVTSLVIIIGVLFFAIAVLFPMVRG